MTSPMTIKRKIHFRTGSRSERQLKEGPEPEKSPSGRVPRISRLMALAIRFDQLISDGVVADQAELARLGHVSRARVTQIMNLLHLAPDIQERILFLPRIERGRDPIQLRHVLPIAAEYRWRQQRREWALFFYPQNS